MITKEMIHTLSCAGADAEMYGQKLGKAISRMWSAAHSGDLNKLDDAYGDAKYEAHHLRATMLAVNEAMRCFEERTQSEEAP